MVTWIFTLIFLAYLIWRIFIRRMPGDRFSVC